MFSSLFIPALWSPAGKGLTSWLLFVMFNCVLVFFIYNKHFLGQVWYLIVKIPDLCIVTYFVTFPCGIRGSVLYLIVSTPNLCRLYYFYSIVLYQKFARIVIITLKATVINILKLQYMLTMARFDGSMCCM